MGGSFARQVVAAVATALISGELAGSFAEQASFETGVDTWTFNVRHHRPGTLDAQARAVVSLPWTTLTPIHEEIMRQADPVLLLRGATLLLDLAVHVPASQRPQIRGLGAAIIAEDGEPRGTGSLDSHLWWGRRLADRAIGNPDDPRHTEMRGHAAAWYRTVTAILTASHDLADLQPHVERSLKLFPEDAGMLFDAGCYAETFASPMIQAVVLQREPIPSHTKAIDMMRAYRTASSTLLADAEKHYRRSLERDPSSTEARVRLGRVLTRQGQAEAAAGELQKAIGMPASSTVKYYAFLFLGRALEAANDSARAIEAFRSAAALFPNAQSPHLAISKLDADRGDTRAAHHAIDRAFGKAGEESERDDPWWTYHRCTGRDADVIYQQFAARVAVLAVAGDGVSRSRQ